MTRRALIVNDDSETCAMLVSFLITHGITSLALQESDAVIGHLWAEKFSLVFLFFPAIQPDGIELTSWIRKSGINRHTPIAVISSDPDQQVLIRSFKAGATFFLYKPNVASLLKLLGAVQHAIASEKRRFERIPLKAKVHLSSKHTELHGETVDVSLGGLLVRADRIIPPGNRAEVRIYLPEETNPIEASAAIVRIVSKNEMGIRLNQLHAREQPRFEKLLLALARPQPALATNPITPV